MTTQKIQKRLDFLTNQILWLQKKLKEFPDGKLYCERDGHYIKWFIRKGKDNKKKYLPKTQRHLAKQLIQKRYSQYIFWYQSSFQIRSIYCQCTILLPNSFSIWMCNSNWKFTSLSRFYYSASEDGKNLLLGAFWYDGWFWICWQNNKEDFLLLRAWHLSWWQFNSDIWSQTRSSWFWLGSTNYRTLFLIIFLLWATSNIYPY